MPSPYKEIPITFEKGLVTEIEESLLDVGQASELINWEPGANGALRARNAWSSISKTGLPSTYSVRGFGSIAIGASGAAVSAPTIMQTAVWPNANADPVATKTVSLNGCNIGNVLVAVVADDSEETPSVSAGFTQRAVTGVTEKEYVRFYTKTVDSSSESFTYTITTSRIRSVTLYEIANMDAESPGDKWAASTTFAGGGGTDTMTVTATDTDGGIAIVGTFYDGGTPNTTIGGTAGMTAVSTDNQNSRTGVTFEDLDTLSSGYIDSGAGANPYVSPSWTPPDTGVLICLVMRHDASAFGADNVTGNNLTWTLQDSNVDSVTSNVGWAIYTADLSQAGKTTGSITVTPTSLDANTSWSVMFVRAIGANTTTPIIQTNDVFDTSWSTSPENMPTLGALSDGSAILGAGFAWGVLASGAFTLAASGAGWTGQLNSYSGQTSDEYGAMVLAYQDADDATTNGSTMTASAGVGEDGFRLLIEVGGTGSASLDAHGTFSTNGTVTDQYTYVANKRVTAKMAVWGYTPQEVDSTPGQVTFSIVMALAVGASTYQVYALDRDEITSGTWELLDQVADAGETSSWVSFAQGAGRLAWTATSLTAPRSIQLNPVIPSNISDMAGLSGRSAVYHKDRLFIAGSEANPSRVYFSDIGLPTDFTTVTDFLDIGGDDGEAIQGMVSVEGLLLVAKTNRAYLVSGSGIESFFVNELSGGTAASGQPLARTPYGTVLAGVDDIWVIQGGGVDPMSRPLGSGYVITGNVSVGYAQDSALVCDSGTGNTWRVNLVTGAWSLEDVDPNPIYTLFSLNGRWYYGTNDNADEVGGTRKLSDARTFDAVAGGTNFLGSTGRLALLGPSVKYTPRWLFIQARNHDTAHPNSLYVDIESDHGITRKSILVSSETDRERIDIPKEHMGSEWVKFTLSADSSAIAGAIDPERLVLGVDVEAPR